MAQFLNDPFTAATNTGITDHTTYTTWTRNGSTGAASVIIANSVRGTTSNIYTSSGTPAGPDYKVTANLQWKDATNAGNGAWTGVIFGFVNASNFYFAGFDGYGATVPGYMKWCIIKCVAGSWSNVGTAYAYTPAYNDVVNIEAGRTGSTVYLKIDGVERVTGAADAGITGNGKAGFLSEGGLPDTNKGQVILDITADDITSADTQAPNVPSPTVGTRTASQITWSWSAVSDNGGGATAGYQVQLLDAADAVLATTDLGSVLTYTCPSTTGNTTRKLKVLAYDNAVPRNNSAYSSAVSSTTLSKTASFVVKDANGTAQASESSLRWAACTGTVGSALTVVAQGTNETTDGSGSCTVDLNSTSLSAGNSITVILADDSPSARLGVLEGVTVSEA